MVSTLSSRLPPLAQNDIQPADYTYTNMGYAIGEGDRFICLALPTLSSEVRTALQLPFPGLLFAPRNERVLAACACTLSKTAGAPVKKEEEECKTFLKSE